MNNKNRKRKVYPYLHPRLPILKKRKITRLPFSPPTPPTPPLQVSEYTPTQTPPSHLLNHPFLTQMPSQKQPFFRFGYQPKKKKKQSFSFSDYFVSKKYFLVDYPNQIKDLLTNLNNFSLFFLEKGISSEQIQFCDVNDLIDQIRELEKNFENYMSKSKCYCDHVNELENLFADFNKNNKKIFNVSSSQEEDHKFRRKIFTGNSMTPIMGITIGTVRNTNKNSKLFHFSKVNQSYQGINVNIQYDDVEFQNPCRVNYIEDPSFLLKVKLLLFDCNSTRYFEPYNNFEQRQELIIELLANGIWLLGKRFLFLSPPTGGPKTKTCYFYEESKINIINKLLFDKIRTKDNKMLSNSMKMLKRRALCFTKIIPTIVIRKNQIKIIPDVLKIDPNYENYKNLTNMLLTLLQKHEKDVYNTYVNTGLILKKTLLKYIGIIDKNFDEKYILNFTDGSGLIGKNVMITAIKHYNSISHNSNEIDWEFIENDLLSLPSVIQIRFLGCKGTLILDERKEMKDLIQIRESQIKYDSNIEETENYERMLEIHSIAIPKSSARTNVQLIQHLNERGIEKEYFLKLQKIQFEKTLRIFNFLKLEKKKLIKLLKQKKTFNLAKIALRKILSGFNVSEPTLQHNLIKLTEQIIENKYSKKCLKRYSRIYLNDSRYFFGVPDFLNILEKNEIFVQIVNEKITRVLLGDVILCKMPINHINDIELVKAVDRKQFSNLCNIIIFNTRGKIPLASRISRSDYDGDEFLVIFDQELIEMYKKTGNNQYIKMIKERFDKRLSQRGEIDSSFTKNPIKDNQDLTLQQLPSKKDLIESFVMHNGLLLGFYSDLLTRIIDRVGYANDNMDHIGETYSLIQELLDMKKKSCLTKKNHFRVIDEKLEVPDFQEFKFSVNQLKKRRIVKSENALGYLYRNFLLFIQRIKSYHLKNNVKFKNLKPGIDYSEFVFSNEEKNLVKNEIECFSKDYIELFRISKELKKVKEIKKKKIIENYRNRFIDLEIGTIKDFPMNNYEISTKKIVLFYKFIAELYMKPEQKHGISLQVAVKYIDEVIIDFVTKLKCSQVDENETNTWYVNEKIIESFF